MQNPDLRPVNNVILYQYIGEHTHTSIRRSMYCTVRGIKYQLPTPEVLDRLAPNNYEVDAYYMPDSENKVTEIYLYQDRRFIAVCEPVKLYNEAKIEQTEADVANYTEQAKYVSQFDAMVRREKIRKVKVCHKSERPVEPENVDIVGTIGATPDHLEPSTDFDDYRGEMPDYQAIANEDL